MRQIILWIAALLLCASAVYGSSGISIGNAIYYDGMVRVGITNTNSYDLGNARIRMFVTELDAISPARTVGLDKGNTAMANLYAVEEIPKGEYLVRISVKKDGKSRTAYRHVYFE